MSRYLIAGLAVLAVAASAAQIEPALQEQMAKARDGEKLGVVIVLEEQLDAENIISTVKNKQERWETTVYALKSMAARSQVSLLGELRSAEAAESVSDIKPLWIVNAVYCEAVPEVIEQVAVREDVRYVQWDLIVTENALAVMPDVVDIDDPSFTIEWNVSKVKADSVWWVHGYTGDGVIVGDIDTGCDYTHPDLADHMWTDPNYPNHGWDFENDDNDPMDSNGHGTHTCGTVAGDGTGGDTTGMAPNAQIMACRTKTSISQPYPDTIAENTVMNSMQFCIAPPLSPENHANLLTMSLGWIIRSWSPRQAVWRQSLDNVRAAGIPYFIAAGNEASGNEPINLRCPGNVPSPWHHPAAESGGLGGSISIGATDDQDNIASFSSRGPVSWDTIDPYFDYPYPPGLLKPDFSAPGVDVTSTRMGGGYTQMSGTSMATPCAAGVCALMLEKNPDLLPEEVDEIMQGSVLPLGTPPKNNTYGTGRIDAMLCIDNTPFPGPMHDVAVLKTNIGDQVKANRPITPKMTICNRGDYVEPAFQVWCTIDSSGTLVYAESLAVDSIGVADTLHYTFPTWMVGPDGAQYRAMLFHNVAADERPRNDTLRQVTSSSSNLLRIAIEIAAGSRGRIEPNACYAIDDIREAEGWGGGLVDGTELDEWDELMNYDVVLTGDDGFSDNDFAHYDEALLEWVQRGGGFVGLGMLVYGIYNGPGSGSAMDSVSAAKCSRDYGYVSSGQVRILSDHEITEGVGQFTVQDIGEYPQAGLWDGAVMLGDYTDNAGRPSIAYKMLGEGRSVYLGPGYFADFGSHETEPYFRDGNAVKLLVQAIRWAASGPGAGVADAPRSSVPVRAGITEIRPNPLTGQAVVRYSLTRPGNVSLAVFDLAGQKVRTLKSGPEQGGQNAVAWNRSDDAGRKVPAGIYFCRFEAEDRTDTRKLVVR